VAFSVPQFNLSCNVWYQGADVTNDAPADTFECALMAPSRSFAMLPSVVAASGGDTGLQLPVLFMAFDSTVVLPGPRFGSPGDGTYIELAWGPPFYYFLLASYHVAAGWPNAYLRAHVVQVTQAFIDWTGNPMNCPAPP